jgi:hypothetical protein
MLVRMPFERPFRPSLAIDGGRSFSDIEPKKPMFSEAPFSDGVVDGMTACEKYSAL